MSMIRSETLFASAARTASPTAAELDLDLLRHAELLEVCIVTSALALTPSVVPAIEAYNELSGTWQAVLTGAAITATGNVILRYGQNAANVTNLSAQGIAGPRLRVSMTHADTDSITYTVLARVLSC